MNHDIPPGLSLEDILLLAPDPLGFERARLLLSRKKWPSLGWNGSIVWGECRSNGTLRYKIAADISERRFFSNSPATVKPDKYILALLLKWHEEPEAFGKSAPLPGWVAGGLEYAAAVTPRIPKSDVGTNTAAREKRIATMMEGVEGLRRWLLDVARNGLATLQMQDAQAWEATAARLTDHKLSGPARRIRMMKETAASPDWPVIFAANIAGLVLLTEAFSHFEELPHDLKAELLIQGGQNVKKEEALQSPAVADRWPVLHCAHFQEGQLYIQKTWLWGESSGTAALLLDYTWGGESFPQTWRAGSVFNGKLHFYPGAHPLRALPGEGQTEEGQYFPEQGLCPSAAEMANRFAGVVGANPWTVEYPFLLGPIAAIIYNGVPYLCDRDDALVPLDIPISDGLSLLGLGINSNLLVFGLWNGKAFTPLAAQKQGNPVSLFF